MAASCRLFSLAAAAALLFVAVAPMATLASPVVGGVLDLPGTGDPVCEEFTGRFADHYCTRFMNRTTAYFPNPRGHKNFDEADKEFRDFIPLLQRNPPCHEKLGTLLCFIYFPFCQTAYPSLRIYPCKEVCEEVTAPSSECTAIVNSFTSGWNDQLQCQLELYKPGTSGQCADGIAPTYPSGNATMPVPDNNTTTAPAETTEAPTTTTTEAPSCPEDEACNTMSCDSRGNANGGTFKRNEYCFAAKVTVKSYDPQDCKHAYSVTVDEQYDLLTPFNATHATKAPEMGESAIIFTDEHCRDCPKLEDGKTYLIAGLYSKASDGTVTWIVDGSAKKSSLVSDWGSKYRKVGDWVQRANVDLNGRKSRVCEMDGGLVSAEQWHST